MANTDITTGELPTTGPKTAATAKANQDKQVWINEVNPYEFMRHADNGTGGFLFGHYLTAHSRERDFRERRNYSYYPNFTKRIINALVNPCFREKPVREEKTKSPLFEKFLLDCDRRGHSWSFFMKKAARRAKRYGVVFVVIDNDAQVADTVGEAEEANQRPYAYMVSPENACDYTWNRLGQLTRIVFREWLSTDGDGKKVYQFREWTKDKWTLYSDEREADVNGAQGQRKVIDSGDLKLGVLPVIPIYADEPDEEDNFILPHPPLYHVGRTGLAVYDLCSECRELERNQMFSLLVYPVMQGDNIENSEVGTQNMLTFNGTAGHPPEFVAPDPEILRAVMEDRKFLIEQMFEMATLVGIVGVVVKEESGRAKEVEFQSTREVLKEFSLILEDAERAIVGVFGKYIGAELQFEVNYSDNYGLVDINEETDKADKALLLPLPPEVKREVLKDWTFIKFRDKPKDVIEKMIKAVESMGDDEIHGTAGDKDQVDDDLPAAKPIPKPKTKPDTEDEDEE